MQPQQATELEQLDAAGAQSGGNSVNGEYHNIPSWAGCTGNVSGKFSVLVNRAAVLSLLAVVTAVQSGTALASTHFDA